MANNAQVIQSNLTSVYLPGRLGLHNSRASQRTGALTLAGAAVLSFSTFSFLPRVHHNLAMFVSFWAIVFYFILFLAILRAHVQRTGRVLHYRLGVKKVHFVQLAVQGSIYIYWGWYWREVYRYAPLVVAQLVFAYAFDMLLSWSRRDSWVFGFGPVPIVLSTNLFLWFKDSWFLFQFVMIAGALLGKEFIKWKRNDRLVHIFNPSALSLFLVAVAIILLHATNLTRGQEIAFTFSYPPHIYLWIFLVGLLVQSLFSVTLITVSAVIALAALNVVYTYFSGSYQFGDSNIPVLVFLGAHLLVTDPATSPQNVVGKLLFGAFYGLGVFVLRAGLVLIGVPVFFDKLLCVPLLNLSVRLLDWVGKDVNKRLVWESRWRWAQTNAAHIALWSVIFWGLMSTGFLVETNANGNPQTLFEDCQKRQDRSCAEWVRALNTQCDKKNSLACLILGRVLREGLGVPPDPLSANKNLRRACELGLSEGCIGRPANNH